MDVTYTHCAGLDVHKKSVVACCLTPGPHGELVSETRTFGTMTQDLLALSDWLTSKGITHVAMEATAEFGCPQGEARLQPACGQLRRLGRERPPHQERTRPEDRRQR